MEETKKKKLSGGKIAAIVIASILVVVLIAAGGFAIWLFGAKQPESVKLDYVPLNVSMMDKADETGATMKYYVGKDNDVNLKKGFPTAKSFSGSFVGSDGAVKRGSNAKGTPVTITFEDGTKQTINLYSVEGINVFGSQAEKNMRKELGKGHSVVMHEDMVTKDKDSFAIAKDATLYGNGKELHADTISAPRGDKAWGANLFIGVKGASFHIQDLHIFVNTIKPDAEGKMNVDLDLFQYSGTGIDFNSAPGADGEYPESSVTNCIIENGQKLIHVSGANVVIDGCIIRNGADANVAIGTYARKPSKVVVRNSVSMNSMVAGLLFYGWEAANENQQNSLDIQGFFDIYNWKNTNAAKLVPATEAPLDTIVNGQVLKSVNDSMFAPYVYLYDQNKDGKIQMPAAAAKNYPDRDDIEISDSVDERFIHIGIIRLATGSLTGQNPSITVNGQKPSGNNPDTKLPNAGVQESYKEIIFPLPEWVKKPPLDIVKRCDMISYDSTKVPTIAPDQQIDTDTIFKDMIFGRKTK